MKSLAIRCAQALLALIALTPASLVLAHAGTEQAGSLGCYHGSRHVEQRMEQWDPVARRWVSIESLATAHSDTLERRPLFPARRAAQLARFGPFAVINETVAAVVAGTSADSLIHFERMMQAFPRLEQLSFVDAPGTVNDVANLELGRRIRARGLATHIPAHGSARSGAVELFLAGTQRTMEQGALFAVHSWLDTLGRSPSDFAPDDPVNRLYLDYYVDMGMTEADARAFYAMTNSVPHSSALWFGPDQMRPWLKAKPDQTPVFAPPTDPEQVIQIAYVFDSMPEANPRFARLAFNAATFRAHNP